MKEIWRPISGYVGFYEVSNHGRVKSLARTYTGTCNGKPVVKPLRERILRLALMKIGYYTVHLCRDGVPKIFYVHRLVANAFVANPEKLNEVNHLDSDRQNNFHRNLEWTDRSRNLLHAGKNMARPKLAERQIRQIRKSFANGATKPDLAKKYGVDRMNIHAIVERKTWKHVK